MSKALYRTYRSRSFDEVVGQGHVTDLLKHAIEQDKVAHAYLLTGPRGVGKTSVARIIAHAVNGLDYSDDPHLDIIEIDAASNRRIDDIRDLRERVHITPVSSRYKVYIIDEVHMLTGESFNALLKTLEEPPAHVIFILATTEVHKVPATIVSRTQRFHFRPASEEDVVKHLAAIAKKESISIDEPALRLIAQHAGGSFRDSVSLLDQLSSLGTIDKALIESVLGMAESQMVSQIVGALETNDTDTLIGALESIEREGVSPVVLTSQLSRLLQASAKQDPRLYELLDALSDVPKAYDPHLKLIATLVRFTKPMAPRSVAAQVAPSVSFASAVSSKRPKVRKDEPKTKVAEEVTPEELVSPAVKGGFDWSVVVGGAKKHYPALASVLSRANASYDAKANTLTLAFTYALHRKKLENPTNRQQLGALLRDLCKLDPELSITDTTSAKKLDGEAGAIAAIMGGGELVRGAI